MHIDSRGEGTFVFVACGQKLWVVGAPRDPDFLSSTTAWTGNLDVTAPSKDDWRLEGVLLCAGDRLLMRSCTPHAVLTTDDAICHGGHFLAMSTIAETVWGFCHTFFEGHIITNIDHPTIRIRINTISSFLHKHIVLNDFSESDVGHVPDLSTPQGMTDLLMFACAVEIQHVVCFDTYRPASSGPLISVLGVHGISPQDALDRFDVSSIIHDQRIQNAYSRGKTYDVLREAFARVMVTDKNGHAHDPWSWLFIPMLGWLLHALKEYYRRSYGKVDVEDYEEEREVHVTYSQFLRQLEWTSMRWKELKVEFDRLEAQKVP
ncbi:hypothetical protein FA15DRAFT_662241, partial [Coprinopsis marcescibilis]